MDGQLSIFDALDTKPTPPPFHVTTRAIAMQSCGWCGSKNTIGGGACRMPGDDTTGCYYAYCAECQKLYGSPRVWELELIATTPDIDPAEQERIAKLQKHLRGEK